ncbi:MAG TPA: S1 RNA-binding domain-containing protein [Acidimicrobiales bacterium]|nr:S1 RNA-binding domain-containing protein [Acidimicrobiales bacterium]
MATRQVIVDGSNLATEGRNMPSLEQLDQAVREFIAENPDDVITVVVDASFGHRIDPAELPTFEAAEEAGELISPPAGAIGRGDAFLLRIAEKIGATVLSNDSFQEFHGEHPWLFEKGRLVGGKPVPGVGWIFMDRTPVRGAKSREVVKEAKRRKRAETGEAAPTPKAAEKPAAEKVGRPRTKAVDRAIARATQEVVEPKAGSRSRRRRTTAPPAEAVNEPLAFITFIAAHPLGSEVVGAVVEYSSHGAFVDADGARCYVPLSAMGDPPPRKAREVVTKGESRALVVQAFDPQRRGIELALPGFAHLAGGPTAETVEAEIRGEAKPGEAAKPARRRRGKAEMAEGAVEEEAAAPEVTAPEKPARRVRKPAAAAAAPVAGAQPVPAGAGPAGPAGPEEGTPPPRAPRRRVAKAAPGEGPVAPEEAVAAGPRRRVAKAAPAPGAAEEGAAPAPARKRAAARKAPGGAETGGEAAPTAGPRPASGEGQAGEAPARKTAARRTPARKAAAAGPEAAAEATAPPAKAPARRGTRKAVADVGTAGPGTEPVEKVPAARKTGRTAARKATGAGGAAEGSGAETGPNGADKAPAKRSATRKAAPARTAAGEAPPAEGNHRAAAPARKRAPAKRSAPTSDRPAG